LGLDDDDVVIVMAVVLCGSDIGVGEALASGAAVVMSGDSW